jgi:peptidoglycan/xylan/chitin deacetylase (PgdA/CDA1 family)
LREKTTWNRREFIASGLTGVGLTATIPSLLTGSTVIRALATQDARIPITMCHGITNRLTRERFEEYLRIAAELGFATINYDQLYDWLAGSGTLPTRPLMIDVDHPVRSVYTEMFPLMRQYGFTGNLFVNTGYFETACDNPAPGAVQRLCASWDQIRELMMSGWTIGAHTHTHPNLSELSRTDPDGQVIRSEMETNDALLEEHTGQRPQYFAFTGNSTGSTWSTVADVEARRRYKLGRLWITGDKCEIDGTVERYADFVGVTGPDETDGGPPHAVRYISRSTPRFRLPSMELERLIYEPDAFRQYLMRALE